MAKLQEQFIERMFAARDAAHRAHWTTDSGYVHETLAEFYEGVPGEADKFIEACIAATREKPKAPDDVTKVIRETMFWIAENRKVLAHEVPALENIIDEVSKFYLNTLFKLENLR
jgi:uncharacterized protein Yka (UPF0111/DUF47 family)